MKFACLGSGSEGNSLLIKAASGTTETIVMLDCGFSMREAERRLHTRNVEATALSAIVVTHEHQDHVGGVFRLARRYGIPVWMSAGTYQGVRKDHSDIQIHFCRDGEPFSIGDLEFTPFTVPHDAREPLQYCASDGDGKFGVLTDAGQATPHLLNALNGSDALVLECNHDPQMLAGSVYPASLKRRINSVYGHLSNQAASEILRELDKSRLKKVVGAHLSQTNNTPELARAALEMGLAEHQAEIMIACQQHGVAWINVKS